MLFLQKFKNYEDVRNPQELCNAIDAEILEIQNEIRGGGVKLTNSNVSVPYQMYQLLTLAYIVNREIGLGNGSFRF